MDTERVLTLFRALAREQVRYKVVGGVALNFHGILRATEDLDIFVDPKPENIARLKTALRSVYHDPHIDEITADDLAGDYPAIQYIPPDEGFSIDILARLGTAFDHDSIETSNHLVEDIPVPVATPRMLYQMKKNTVRPQDRADAARLKNDFGLADAD